MNSSARLLFPLALVPFVLLATANSAGYRFGASDLAFYGPAVMRELDPALFPRDAPVLDAQARLTLMDETVATIARLTTRDLPLLLLALYLATLLLLGAGAALIGTALYRSVWATAALLIALTLRHAIARSGTNTLEPYFHPRQLAFAFGILAIAAFLRSRPLATAAALTGAALLHPTTTMWFVVWVGVALFWEWREARIRIFAASAGAVLVGIWAFAAGPLAGRLMIMDREWLDAIGDKDYLFPLTWPLSVWLLNLAYIPLIVLVHRRRAALGLLHPHERRLVVGCLALLAVFLIALPLNAARVALAIQLQPARIFWMLDFIAIVYLVWAVAEGRHASPRRAQIAAAVLLALSTLRGAWVMRVEFPDRPLFQVGVPGDWGRVTAWARTRPAHEGWLVDPAHASRYGTSFRLSAGRDVFVEAVKDTAIGMYDRSIALRTRDRIGAIPDFSSLSPSEARDLGATYGLQYLLTEQELPLRLAFQAGTLRVYELR